MDKIYLTKAGNIVEVVKRRDEKVFFDRLAIQDSDGDQYNCADGRWAVLPEEWLQSAIKTGVMIPIVRMNCDSFMPEADYADLLVFRAN